MAREGANSSTHERRFTVCRVRTVGSHCVDSCRRLERAGEEKYRQIFLKALEARFGALKIKQRCFECVEVMHEQDPTTFEIWIHQCHYVPQIKEIPCDLKALVSDETLADEDMTALYMSLVGALAWLVLTMPAICVYVAYLQRHTKAPTLGRVRRGNRLLRWIRRNKTRLGVWFRKLQVPLSREPWKYSHLPGTRSIC